MPIGAQLRASREERAISLSALAQRTRIAPTILRAIERDDFRAVPTGIFVRGYLRAYAKEVGQDPEAVVSRYLAEQEPPDPRAAPALDDTTRIPSLRKLLDNSVWREYGLIALALMALLLVYGRSWTSSKAAIPDVPPVATQPARADEAPGPPPPTRSDRRLRVEADAVGAAHRLRNTGLPRDPVRVTLVATGVVWVSAEADGSRVLYRLLSPDEKVVLTANQRIQLRVGDAGALLVSTNGSDAATVGAPGQVRDLDFARDGTLDQ